MFKKLISSSRQFPIKAVTFDGTNDYMTRGADLTGNADGKVGLLSFWIKLGASSDGAESYIFVNNVGSASGYFRVYKGSTNDIFVWGFSAGPATTIALRSTAIALESRGWFHVLASWDVANNKGHLFIDGVDVESTETINDVATDYTGTNWGLGAKSDGNAKTDADLAEFYFALEYLDITSAANIQKFILNGEPVYLGIDGSTPTGTAPIVYFSVRSSDAATVWATNKGSGGNFSITGALAIAASSPSD